MMGSLFSSLAVRYYSMRENSAADLIKILFGKNPRKNVDNLVGKVTEECLTNIIVLTKILEHFSHPELLKLSFVNKLWNYEARSVMKKRSNLNAKLKVYSEDDSYQKFANLEFDLQRMNIVPFCGLSIYVDYDDDGQLAPFPIAGLASTIEASLDRLSIKHFSVRLDGKWWDHEDCPALLLIKRVFQYFSPVLETLDLHIDDGEGAFIPKVVQHVSFPHLKIFKPSCWLYASDESYINLVKAILSRAPNLQELHSSGDINLLGKLLEGSSAVLLYSFTVKAPFDEISDSVIPALRLEDMLLFYTGPQFNIERFYRITPILLQICCTTTLRELKVDAILSVPLMSFGVCLKNVKFLGMIVKYEHLERFEKRILEVVKNFDFTRIFPSLDKVIILKRQSELDLDPAHMNLMIEKAKAVLREPQPDRAVNIKQLDLKVALSRVNAQFFAKMFPSIHRLGVENGGEEIPFGSIWEHWRDLQELYVEGKISGNLDSVFCGIFPEEVAELRLMEDEFLERVNIVPVMLSINCLRSLRKIIVRLNLTPLQDPALLFSKVSRLTAFKRPRSLTLYKAEFFITCR